MIIDEGALPLLEKLVIGDCPQLKVVPSGIYHLKSLKNLQFEEMPTKFVLSLQPNEGLDFGKVKHIPSITFRYRVHGEHGFLKKITTKPILYYKLDRVSNLFHF